MADAETFKKQGNDFYAQKEYGKAVDEYTKAIERDSKCAAYYGNRSAAYLMNKDFNNALEDSLTAVRMDPKFLKCMVRAAKLYQQRGQFEQARQFYRKSADLDMASTYTNELAAIARFEAQHKEVTELVKNQDWDKAIGVLLNLTQHCDHFVDAKLQMAQALIRTKRNNKATDIIMEVMALSPNNDRAHCLRAESLLYSGNPEAAAKLCQQLLQLDPDFAQARTLLKKIRAVEKHKEEGNNHFKAKAYDQAVASYTEAINVDPSIDTFVSVLFANRAAAHLSAGRYAEAEADCTRSLAIDSQNVKTLLRRARCYTQLEKYEEAVRDYNEASRLEPGNRDIKISLREAELALKKAKRKDHYKILGIAAEAGDSDIKRAYRKMALQHHPDKCAGDEEARVEAEKRFKDITEAYSVLSDPVKRRRFDQGIDDEPGMGGFGGGGMDMNDIFRAFMAQQGGGMRFGGGGGGFGGGFGGGRGFHGHSHFGGGHPFFQQDDDDDY